MAATMIRRSRFWAITIVLGLGSLSFCTGDCPEPCDCEAFVPPDFLGVVHAREGLRPVGEMKSRILLAHVAGPPLYDIESSRDSIWISLSSTTVILYRTPDSVLFRDDTKYPDSYERIQVWTTGDPLPTEPPEYAVARVELFREYPRCYF